MTISEVREVVSQPAHSAVYPEMAFVIDAGQISKKIGDLGSCAVFGVATDSQASRLSNDIKFIAENTLGVQAEVISLSADANNISKLRKVTQIHTRTSNELVIISGANYISGTDVRQITPREQAALKVTKKMLRQGIGPKICGISVEAYESEVPQPRKETNFWNNFAATHDFDGHILYQDAEMLLREHMTAAAAGAFITGLSRSGSLTWGAIRDELSCRTAVAAA